MFRRSSIRVKFLLLVLAILIPLVAFRANTLLEDFHQRINSELDSYESMAEAVSTSFINYLEEVWTIEDMAGTYIKANPTLSIDEINSYLELVSEKQKGILSISWLNPEGIVLASSNEPLRGTSVALKPNSEQADGRNEKIIHNLSRGIVNPSKYVLPVSRTIIHQGEKSGFIVATIDIAELSTRLPNFKVMPGYCFSLIDAAGVLVYRNDRDKAPDTIISLMGTPSVKQALKGEVVKGVKERSDIDGTLAIFVDYPISEVGWVCRVTSPYEAAIYSHKVKIRNEIVVLCLLLGVSTMMALLFGHSILKPTLALRQAASQIMKGDYSARTNIKGGDEISLAAEAFDKMAESVEQWYKVKSQYFTNISHELKTPINVIFASVQLIETYKGHEMTPAVYEEKVVKQMKIIRQNCYRIMRPISNLTDISRYDSGFLNIKLDNYDIVKLTQKITLSVQRYAEVKGISLVYQSDMPYREMACDPDMIERIMLNLISNAIKFTDKGGTITVRLKEYDSFLNLSVADTGIGIPKEKLSDIFERFKQTDDPCKRNKEGSGIGLSLVKAFVEAHGGAVSVSSEPMKGSSFEISLPIRVVDTLLPEKSLNEKSPYIISPNAVSRTHIEFSDIYSCLDENIS